MALYDIIGGLTVRRLITGDEMREIDNYTINELGTNSFVLMERAAMSVCRHITENDKHYLAVCGIGNNGGDAIAVARILCSKGINADILLCENDKEKGSEGFKYQLKQAKNFGVNIYYEVDIKKYDYIIDGIFGIGLAREVQGRYKNIIDKINESEGKVIAVDCPSGVDCNTGRILGTAINANVTVTFGAIKKGLVLYPAAEYAGKVIVEDIGFPDVAFDKVLNIKNYMTDAKDIELLPKRYDYSNKGSYGKVAVIAGGLNMCGAAVLAAKACYAIGAGLVKVITCEENRIIIQNQVPEAILATYNEDIAHIRTELEWADVVLIGPGLSTNDVAKGLVKMALESNKAMVMDADAINILSYNRELKNKLKSKNIIITPHLGEMSRLIGKSIDDIAFNLTECCRSFAKEYNIVCVLKDTRTIVSNGENYVVNAFGNSGMAKAGSGDVLAGIITGILAQKNNVYDSAILGVYLHSMAGDSVAIKKGKYSMSPMDMIDEISNVISHVEANL